MNIIILLKNGQEIEAKLNSESDLLKITDRINDGKAIVIGGSVYHGWEITRIMNEKDYNSYKTYKEAEAEKKLEAQMRSSGLWKCGYGYWHERNQECGHDLALGGKPSTKIDGFIEYSKPIEKPNNSIKELITKQIENNDNN
jgi:hypothetical protein